MTPSVWERIENDNGLGELLGSLQEEFPEAPWGESEGEQRRRLRPEDCGVITEDHPHYVEAHSIH